STGGATPGTGGTTPGTGGAAPGTGGTTPGTGGTTPGSGGSTVADGGSGTITAQYGAAAVYSGGRQYIIQNNVWASNSSQAISYDANSFTITQQTGNNDNQAAPVSFPSDRKSTRLNSSHVKISYAVFCLKKKKPSI